MASAYFIYLPHTERYLSFGFIAGNEPETDSADQVTPGELSLGQEASIVLLGSLFERVKNKPNVGMTFGFYNETILFPVREGSVESKSTEGRQTQVGSLIASVIVGVNQTFQDLRDPVINTFRLRIPPEMV